jgi:hypothetical protein
VVRVRVQDGNAGDYAVSLRFGDGDGAGTGRYVECLVPAGVSSMDQTFEFPHSYKKAGRMHVSVVVTTRECWTSLTGLGDERATATAATAVRR